MTKEILKDEILKDEQLNEVAGGTMAETRALYKAACSNPVFVRATNLDTTLTEDKEIAEQMMEALDNMKGSMYGLDAYVSDRAGDKSSNFIYDVFNKHSASGKLTNAQMVEIIKNYNGK